jgi:RNA polymerase sigma factor (sigma-70 family)
MAEPVEQSRENAPQRPQGVVVSTSDAEAWFVREVLPLEATLIQFLRHNWRNKSEIADLRQEVYARVFAAAINEIPEKPKPFVLTTARNLLINRMRDDQVVRIDAVADLDSVDIAVDEPSADRAIIAREELRQLQDALDRLPKRARQAVILKKIEGLSRREIATRMGIAEKTVKRHLTEGMCALADTLYGADGNRRKKA